MKKMRSKGRKEQNRGVRSLRRRMILQSVFVVIVSVWIFELVDFFFNMMLNRDRPAVYDPILGIGMIFPMSLLMWWLSRRTYRETSGHVSLLIGAIHQVSSGDFQVRLDPREGGAFREVFADFNRMGAELQSVQTLREDFVNHFSHEFKTPIQSISGFARLLLEEPLSEEERRSYLEIIARESERLAALSSSTLLLSKLDSLKILPDREVFSLDEQIRECVILLAPEWSQKKLDLSADLEPANYTGSPDLMKQVWLNLLGNAVKFTPPGGEVTLTLREEPRQIVVTVSDTGPGMTGEEISRAFEKYYQGEEARAVKGLGLGLAICRKITDLCGGEIRIDSAPGRGSRFTVSLPKTE